MTLKRSRLQLTRKLICPVAVVELLIFCLHLKGCSQQLQSVCISFSVVCVCLCACLVKFEPSEATKCQTETVLVTNSRTDKVKLHIFTIIFNLFFYNVIKIPMKYTFAYIVACNAPLSFSKQSGLFAFKKHLEIVVDQEALT